MSNNLPLTNSNNSYAGFTIPGGVLKLKYKYEPRIPQVSTLSFMMTRAFNSKSGIYSYHTLLAFGTDPVNTDEAARLTTYDYDLPFVNPYLYYDISITRTAMPNKVYNEYGISSLSGFYSSSTHAFQKGIIDWSYTQSSPNSSIDPADISSSNVWRVKIISYIFDYLGDGVSPSFQTNQNFIVYPTSATMFDSHEVYAPTVTQTGNISVGIVTTWTGPTEFEPSSVAFPATTDSYNIANARHGLDA